MRGGSHSGVPRLQRQMRADFPKNCMRWAFRGGSASHQGFLQRIAGAFRRKGCILREAETVAIWGNVPKQPLPENVPIIRVEDGFLALDRARGRTSAATFARDGPRRHLLRFERPSALENILASYDFDDELLARAKRLRDRLTAARLTKYNLSPPRGSRRSCPGASSWFLGKSRATRPSDLARPASSTNIGLLHAVREKNRQITSSTSLIRTWLRACARKDKAKATLPTYATKS